ncbi:MAG: mechanosensitive ion channel domain-containing protein [Candidatus Micrarchaeaceae archaeon]
MTDGRLSLASIVEPIATIAAIIAYSAFAVYHVVTPIQPNPLISIMLFQIALGLLIIFVGALSIEIYGKYTENKKEMHELAHIFKLLCYPILIIILLHTLNISIASLLVGAGFLGIVFGLAAQASLGNMFSGLSIMYSRPFTHGEKITIIPTSYSFNAPTYPHEAMMNEITGTVKSLGLVYTRILKDDMSILYIPNNAINQSIVVNHSRVYEKQIKVRLEAKRTTSISAFRKKLTSKLSSEKEDFEKLRDLIVKISLISSGESYGIVITARVKMLEYDLLSQWLSETAIMSLVEVEGKKSK